MIFRRPVKDTCFDFFSKLKRQTSKHSSEQKRFSRRIYSERPACRQSALNLFVTQNIKAGCNRVLCFYNEMLSFAQVRSCHGQRVCEFQAVALSNWFSNLYIYTFLYWI